MHDDFRCAHADFIMAFVLAEPVSSVFGDQASGRNKGEDADE